MEMRSIQSFNGIPAAITSGVFNMYLSNFVNCIVTILYMLYLCNHCKYSISVAKLTCIHSYLG